MTKEQFDDYAKVAAGLRKVTAYDMERPAGLRQTPIYDPEKAALVNAILAQANRINRMVGGREIRFVPPAGAFNQGREI